MEWAEQVSEVRSLGVHVFEIRSKSTAHFRGKEHISNLSFPISPFLSASPAFLFTCSLFSPLFLFHSPPLPILFLPLDAALSLLFYFPILLPTLPYSFPLPCHSLTFPSPFPSSCCCPLPFSFSLPSLSASFSDTIQAASTQGILDCLQLLLEAGADVDCRDQEGSTPLHWALQAPS